MTVTCLAANITILESQKIEGGALDGAGNAEEGWPSVRGQREMEMTYQNFWDVFFEISALELPEPFTVLDEYWVVNDADKNWSKARLLEKQGQIRDFSTMHAGADCSSWSWSCFSPLARKT